MRSIRPALWFKRRTVDREKRRSVFIAASILPRRLMGISALVKQNLSSKSVIVVTAKCDVARKGTVTENWMSHLKVSQHRL